MHTSLGQPGEGASHLVVLPAALAGQAAQLQLQLQLGGVQEGHLLHGGCVPLLGHAAGAHRVAGNAGAAAAACTARVPSQLAVLVPGPKPT